MPKTDHIHTPETPHDTIVTPDKKISTTMRNTTSKNTHDKWNNIFKMNAKSETTIEQPGAPMKKKSRFHLKKWHKIGLSILTILLVLLVGMGIHTFSTINSIKAQADELLVVSGTLKEQLKAQNLPATEATLIDIQNRMQRIKGDYSKLAYYSAIPVARSYYLDGQHAFTAGDAGIKAGLKTIDALVPYADVLGFEGEGTFEGGTTEDRIKVLLETLSKVTPVIDDISNELTIVDAELSQINPNRYPEQIQGRQLRSNIVDAQQLVKGSLTAMTEFKPVLEVLPQIAGSETARKYLVIFQNDNELRPTGGFMTAYAVMKVEDGKATPEKSDDIYELDKKFSKRIPIPQILGRYLTSERYFNLRDMNVNPDFKLSMDTFYEHYREVPGEPDNIDGIISIDTNVLTEMVRVLGPVEVPGYGTFSAENDPRCDCPQIIYVLSEIVDRPTPYLREDRKGIIAPMMQAILQKAYSAPKEQWPQLAELAWKKIEEKHVQFYFFDEEFQSAAEIANAAGRMNKPAENQDYLAVVDANLGGAKSNLFVETEGKLAVSQPKDGTITNTLTLKYKNDRRGDNCNLEAGQLCLNGTLRDWVRIYLPKGAKLTNSNGFDENTLLESEDEATGMHVIEGVFRLAPLSQSTLQIEYTVPYSNGDTYRLLMRKQAGTDPWKYLLDINGHEEEVILNKDLKIEIDF